MKGTLREIKGVGEKTEEIILEILETQKLGLLQQRKIAHFAYAAKC